MDPASQCGDHLSFTFRRPRFFKIILEDTIVEGKLGIPKKFLRKYGSGLPNLVSLRAPNDMVWHVELSRRGSNVWLQNGWRAFAEHYSLEYGHLVIFEHRGGGQFHFLIFDKSATEINYLCNIAKEHKEASKEQIDNDDSVEILDDFATSPGSRGRSHFVSRRPHKKRRTCSSSQTDRTNHKLDECGAGLGSQAGVAKRRLTLTSEEYVEAFQTASSFQSVNPFFKMVMQSSYLRGKTGLFIPNGFAREYLREKQSNVVLCVSDGRTWSGAYHYTRGNQSNRRAIFNNVWSKFWRDNSLKVGDLCVFELIKMVEIKFKVHIVRGDEDPNIDLLLGHNSRPNRLDAKTSLEKKIESEY